MDNPPFANDFPIKSPFCRGFPIAAVDCRRVDLLQTWNTMGIRDITRHISDILIDLLASSSWLIIIWEKKLWNTMWYKSRIHINLDIAWYSCLHLQTVKWQVNGCFIHHRPVDPQLLTIAGWIDRCIAESWTNCKKKLTSNYLMIMLDG